MNIVNITPRIWNPLGNWAMHGAHSTPALLNAAGESVAMLGQVWWKGAVRNVSKTFSSAGGAIYVPVGTGLVFADGSTTITVGVQGLTGGFESGTYLVSGSLVGGVDTILGSQYNRFPMETGTTNIIALSTSVAIIVEMVSRGGSDSINIDHVVRPYSSLTGTVMALPFATTDVGAGPVKSQRLFPFIIESDDGTLLWIFGASAALAMRGATLISVSASSTPDEYANVFTPNLGLRVLGVWAEVNVPSLTDTGFQLGLYEDPYGTPENLGTVTSTLVATGDGIYTGWFNGGSDPTYRDLVPGTPYAIAVRSTGTAVVDFGYRELGTGTARLKEFSHLPSCQLATRSDGSGAFSDGSTTQILHAGLLVSGLGVG